MDTKSTHVRSVVVKQPWPMGLIPNRKPLSSELQLKQVTSVYKVPYAEQLPSKLSPGKGVYIVGTVHPNADRFSVNLVCGMKDDADVAFHLNPRFYRDYVVRNSFIAKHWGEEELLGYQKNPFKRGELFYLLIFVADSCYMVSVNGTPFCSFGHRINYHHVNTLKIEGGVILDKIEHRQLKIYPEPCPLKLKMFETVDSLSQVKDRPLNLPFLLQLPTAFTVGKEIEITGKMKMLPVAFFINLQSGTRFWPHTQIALHVNPRFIALGGTVVVFNSWLSGEWGNEESSRVYYFRPGRAFTINIRCEKNEYALKIDGSLVGTYRQRTEPETVNTVHVQGDIFLQDVKVIV